MKLLLATDGSTFSAAATQAVISVVKRDGTEIQTMHVVDTRKAPFPEMTAVDAEVIDAPLQRRSAEALVRETAELLHAGGLKATTLVVWGDPRSKIIEAAKEWRADLIVLGSQQRTAPEGFSVGGVSDAVAHHAPCSVEIVRVPKGQPMLQDLKILLAMDDSEFSEAAAEAIVEQFNPANTQIKSLSVLNEFPLAEAEKMASHGYPQDESPGFLSARQKLRDQATAKLLKAAEKLQTAGFDVTQTIVEEGDARDIILDCARRWRADLVVVGSHGRKGIKRLLMGSVSEAVSRHAACSVEIVRLPNDR